MIYQNKLLVIVICRMKVSAQYIKMLFTLPDLKHLMMQITLTVFLAGNALTHS